MIQQLTHRDLFAVIPGTRKEAGEGFVVRGACVSEDHDRHCRELFVTGSEAIVVLVVAAILIRRLPYHSFFKSTLSPSITMTMAPGVPVARSRQRVRPWLPLFQRSFHGDEIELEG